jgi:hypothetical protein
MAKIRNCERCCKILSEREGIYNTEGKLFCGFRCLDSYENYMKSLPYKKR